MDRAYVLIDGNSIGYQAWLALQGKHTCETPEQLAGLWQKLFWSRLISAFDYLPKVSCYEPIICWDGPASVRKRSSRTYKANRKRKEVEELLTYGEAVRIFQHMAKALGLVQFVQQVPGLEADDLIAAFASLQESPVVIVSADKDFFQLLSERVTQVRPLRQGISFWDAARVVSEYGLQPQHFSLFLAIVGDSTDGVPGVPGIGPKRFSKLLAELGPEKLKKHFEQEPSFQESLKQVRLPADWVWEQIGRDPKEWVKTVLRSLRSDWVDQLAQLFRGYQIRQVSLAPFEEVSCRDRTD